MKKILLLLLLPVTAFCQKVELTEIVGIAGPFNYSTVTAYNNISAGYYFNRKFSLEAGYMLNNGLSYRNTGYGIIAKGHAHDFYYGGSVYGYYVNPIISGSLSAAYSYLPESYSYTKYSQNYSIGIFAGTKQKIVKHVYFNQELGLSHMISHFNRQTEYYNNGTTGFSSGMNMLVTTNLSGKYSSNYIYAALGLCLQL